MIPTLLDPLLQIAAALLDKAEFATAKLELSVGGHELLLAENPYFIVAVAVSPSISGLRAIDDVASVELARRVAAADIGPKQWDAYLVLLTTQRAATSADDVASLAALAHDTRAVRRLVLTDVQPGTDSLARALRPFLPLRSAPSSSEATADSLSLLREELVTQGLDPTSIGTALRLFRESAGAT
jgi:hypothetical protein